jgi:Skp family chaperone for outer membrane proteins
MTKYLLGAAAAALLLAIPGAASAQRGAAGPILIVDTERVLSECNACRSANAQLQTQVTQARQRADALAAPLRTEQQSLETAVRALNGRAPDPALQARITAFQGRQNTATQEMQGRQQNLESIQANINRQIGERLGPVITTIMNQHGASIVLAKGATLASVDPIEVTNEVLTALNAALPSVVVAPMPQQPAAAPGTQPQGR